MAISAKSKILASDITSALNELKNPAKSVGDMWFGFDSKSKPANVQLYAGQTLSRSSYAAHWAFVNGGNRTVISETEWQAQVTANGFCPYYSSGNGSSTYRMPLLKGIHPKFVEALASAGAYTKAGLPNITGDFNSVDTVASGAFSSSEGWAGGYMGAAVTVSKKYLSAARSNAIYGNSDTVQPPAINMIVGEYVVGTVATIGEANATSLLASITHLEATAGTVKFVNGVNADAAGNVSDVSARGETYIRFTNGLQICWDSVSVSTSGTQVTFPAAFNGTPVMQTIVYGSNTPSSVNLLTNTKVTLYHGGSVNTTVHYVAIGYWK